MTPFSMAMLGAAIERVHAPTHFLMSARVAVRILGGSVQPVTGWRAGRRLRKRKQKARRRGERLLYRRTGPDGVMRHVNGSTIRILGGW